MAQQPTQVMATLEAELEAAHAARERLEAMLRETKAKEAALETEFDRVQRTQQQDEAYIKRAKECAQEHKDYAAAMDRAAQVHPPVTRHAMSGFPYSQGPLRLNQVEDEHVRLQDLSLPCNQGQGRIRPGPNPDASTWQGGAPRPEVVAAQHAMGLAPWAFEVSYEGRFPTFTPALRPAELSYQVAIDNLRAAAPRPVASAGAVFMPTMSTGQAAAIQATLDMQTYQNTMFSQAVGSGNTGIYRGTTVFCGAPAGHAVGPASIPMRHGCNFPFEY